MCCISKYALSAMLLKRFSRFTQGAAGVDHVVNDNAVTAFDITDDVHDLRDVSRRSTLINNGQIGIIH